VIATLDGAVKDDIPLGWRLPLAILSFSISIASIERLHRLRIVHKNEDHPPTELLRK
jgi:hypothetical protein